MKLLEPGTGRVHLFTGGHEGRGEVGLKGIPTTGIADESDIPPAFLTNTYRKALLLVSDDAALGVSLGNAADLADLAFQQVGDSVTAGRVANQERPAVVFLDLDLPGLEGWRAAEQFLRDENGPPVVLLTARTAHFDLDVAIRAGMVLDKSARPGQVVDRVNRLLAKQETEQGYFRAGQRLLIRWMRPYDWTVAAAPVDRHWGINE